MSNFINRPTGTCLTASLHGDVSISVDGDAADVAVTDAHDAVIYRETLYPADGIAALTDPGTLIEEHLRGDGAVCGTYKFKLFDSRGRTQDTCTFVAVYCDRFTVCTDTETFFRENFLTTLRVRRIAPDGLVSLSYRLTEGETVTPRVDASWCPSYSGHRRTWQETVRPMSADGAQRAEVFLPALVKRIADGAGLAPRDIRLLSLNVTAGTRSAKFFVDHALRNRDCFLFRNCFNAKEYAHFPATTTAKTVVERDECIIGGVGKFYNRSVEKSYEAQSAPLTSDEADWIDQMLSSREVYRFAENGCDDTEPFILTPVNITESTCEIAQTELPTVKFTWQYADKRGIVNLSSSKGIFTNPFDIAFG